MEIDRDYLTQHKIKEIVEGCNKDLVYVDSDTSLEETCKLLGTNKINAVPILDVQKNDFIGILDSVDISLFIAFAYDQKRKDASNAPSSLELFKDVKASDLLTISEEGSLVWTFSALDSWNDTLEPFSKGIHRALVKEESGKYHILSQLDVVKALYESGQFNGSVFDKPISSFQEIFEYQPKLVSITDDTPAIEGFKKLSRDRLGAIAVYDKDGKLVGNLSASDLQGVALDFMLKTLLRPANEFLQIIHPDSQVPTITATYSDNLRLVVQKILINGVHRVWLVDDQGKLNGVLTLTDICKIFSPYK